MEVAIAAGFFTIYAGALASTFYLAGRFQKTRPRDATLRIRIATTTAILCVIQSVWFCAFLVIAASIVIAATPNLPMIEVFLVYGCIIGVIANAATASSWFQHAQAARAARRKQLGVALAGGEVIQSELVPVLLPRHILDRLRDGTPLTGEDAATIRTITDPV